MRILAKATLVKRTKGKRSVHEFWTCCFLSVLRDGDQSSDERHGRVGCWHPGHSCVMGFDTSEKMQITGEKSLHWPKQGAPLWILIWSINKNTCHYSGLLKSGAAGERVSSLRIHFWRSWNHTQGFITHRGQSGHWSHLSFHLERGGGGRFYLTKILKINRKAK